jgi:hypothetical protein
MKLYVRYYSTRFVKSYLLEIIKNFKNFKTKQGTKNKEPHTRNIFKIILFYCYIQIVTDFTTCKISQIKIMYINFFGFKTMFCNG